MYKLTKLTGLGVHGNQFHDAPIPNAISNLVNLECVESVTEPTRAASSCFPSESSRCCPSPPRLQGFLGV